VSESDDAVAGDGADGAEITEVAEVAEVAEADVTTVGVGVPHVEDAVDSVDGADSEDDAEDGADVEDMTDGADTDAEGTESDDVDEGTDGTPRPLETLLFAPVGVLMTVAEDLPGLIDKGRRRVEQEISNARVVGAFVVRMGQKDVVQRVGRLFGQDAGEPPTAPDEATVSVPAPRLPTPTPKPAADPADHAVVEQAFAGYDTLSASQVVRRLESLEPGQLRSVHRYEASHRNRRTILNRTQQLLDGEPPAGPSGPNGSNGPNGSTP
jgi:hypothetical protein